MFRADCLLLLGAGITLVALPADGQRYGSDICSVNGTQALRNCCDGFLLCNSPGAVGHFTQCATGTLFDDTLGNCNVITDGNNRCHPDRARRENLFCMNSQRQILRNNFNNNRRPNNNNNPRRAQFLGNNFNTRPPTFINNNQNNRFTRNPFQNQNTRFTRNPFQNQNTRFTRIPFQNQNNRFTRNPFQNQNTRFTRIPFQNQNNRFTGNQNSRFTGNQNSRFTGTQNNRFTRNPNQNNIFDLNQNPNNRFQLTNRNRFNSRFTTPNGNRGTVQAPERIQITIRDVNPILRNNCIRFQTEVNREFRQLAQDRLGTRWVPVINIQCGTRQNTRG